MDTTEISAAASPPSQPPSRPGRGASPLLVEEMSPPAKLYLATVYNLIDLVNSDILSERQFQNSISYATHLFIAEVRDES